MGGARKRKNHAYRFGVSTRLQFLGCLGSSAAAVMAYGALLRLGVHTTRTIRQGGLLFSRKNRFSPGSLCLSTHNSSNHTASGGNGDSSRKPKAVIFDLGGVVVPSPFRVFTQFEKQHGLPLGSVVDTVKATGDSGSFARLERGELTVGEFGKPFSVEYRSIIGAETSPEIFKELLESFRSGEQVTARSTILEVIGTLQKHGVKTAILTNNFRYDDGHTLVPKQELNVDVVNMYMCTCL